ncbi:MAG: hypothetical protein EAZ16_12160 [Sphingobacteriales bacterium]|jgi:hypothetical protein|nr:MAG: hypothetical protein EAZ16_12160 [Sphingobacteriales bacterium]
MTEEQKDGEIEKSISDRVNLKLNLYFAATILYEKGKSYPQVVEILLKYCLDERLVNEIAEKSRKDEWEKIAETARLLLAEGRDYEYILSQTKNLEPDTDVVKALVDDWYTIKTMQMEAIVDSSTNITEGIEWVIISGLVIPVLFWMKAGLIPKIFWSVIFVIALIQWFVGLSQRKLANRLKMIFDTNEQI